jgi:hypothetical protein
VKKDANFHVSSVGQSETDKVADNEEGIKEVNYFWDK